MKSDLCIGADIGGTHIRTALVSVDGKILHRRRRLTDASLEPKETGNKLLLECRSLLESAARNGHKVAAVGLGVAGKVDSVRGRVVFSPHLPKMRDYPLALELENILAVPVYLENDANVFGIGEAWLGAGRGINNWLGITLGTGVGGCLILKGKLWNGDGLGFVGEIGHMIIDPEGSRCACGLKGCLETYSSGSALVNGMMDAITGEEPINDRLRDLCATGTLDAEAVYRLAKEGHKPARSLFNRMGWGLGLAIANVLGVLGINHTVIGGGVSAGWDLFIDPLKASLAEHSCMLKSDEMVVRRSKLGDDAALLGAANLAWHKCRTDH